MTKRILSVLLSLMLLLSMSSHALAADNTEFSDLTALQYIQTEIVSQYIADNIDLNDNGVQTIYVGNGIMFQAEVRTTDNNTSLKASYRTKTGSASGYFYTISDNKTVAEYSLSATFEYDGNKYVNIVDSPKHTEDTVSDTWRLDNVTEELQTDTQYIVSGQWTLYYKTGFIWTKYEYNNNTHIDIICSPKGVITYNYK